MWVNEIEFHTIKQNLYPLTSSFSWTLPRYSWGRFGAEQDIWVRALHWYPCSYYEQSLTDSLDSYSMKNKPESCWEKGRKPSHSQNPGKDPCFSREKELKTLCYCGRDKKPSLDQDPALIQSSVLLPLKVGGWGWNMSHTRALTDTRQFGCNGKRDGNIEKGPPLGPKDTGLRLKLNKENEDPYLPPPPQASHQITSNSSLYLRGERARVWTETLSVMQMCRAY